MLAKTKQDPNPSPKNSPTYNTFIGIDPGQSGGIVIISPNHEPICCVMPELDHELCQILESWKTARVYACLEKVSSSPQMGVTSAFTFGAGFGRLNYALTAARIPFELVTPQAWQKELMIPKRHPNESQPDFKDRLLRDAQRRYPSLELWSRPKSLGLQRSIADALLIATYCQLRFGSI